jgi:hypothetical protein
VGGAAAPPPPPAAPKPPAPAAAAKPAPVEPPLPAPIESVGASPAILPAATPPVEPIPPGAGGFAQSPAAAERKEKARKQASQSAFTIRPAGTGGAEWFYVAVGFATLLALLLSARGLPAGPRPRPAWLLDHTAAGDQRRRARRRLR